MECLLRLEGQYEQKLKEGKRGLVSSEEELEEFKRKYSYVVENLKIPPNKFLLAIKLFELEISALQASTHLKVSLSPMILE